MESLPSVDLIGESPAVLGGVAQDPKQQREVVAETDGHAPATKKSKNFEDKKQLILENQELREQTTKYRASIAKLNEDIPKLVKEYAVTRSVLEDNCKRLEDGIAEMLNSWERFEM